MILNNQDPKPLYLQIVNDIQNSILTGKFADGYKLPSSTELAAQYGVSIITIRGALKCLEDQGLIIRKQGKGTFVCHKKLQRNISSPSSFTQFCLDSGVTPSAKVVFTGIKNADEEDCNIFSISKSDKIVIINRVLYINQSAVSFESNHFTDNYSFLLNEDLNNTSLMKLLRDKYNNVFSNLRHSIELEYASDEIAKYLNLNPGYPLLRLDSHCDSITTGLASYRCDQHIIGDKFRFNL